MFSPVAFQLDQQPAQPPSPEHNAERTITSGGGNSIVGTLRRLFGDTLGRFFHPNDVGLFLCCTFVCVLHFSFSFFSGLLMASQCDEILMDLLTSSSNSQRKKKRE